jgi:branched-chain amino acid transport system ATP-binding protein
VSLAVSGLVAGYGATTVLRCVDLVVPAGHVVALLGPNGSGKTTLLRACSGLLRPTAGTVTVDGADRTGQAPHDLVVAGVCHVPEGRAVFPGMTVAENLRLLAPPGTSDHVERAAEAFPVLGDKLDQIAGTLSGGEQQMLALTRAIFREPRYILLDEVSMGLAPRVVEEIFAALRRLVERGSALLLVEQFVHMALALADLVYVMDRGRIAFRGEPVELDADALAAAYLAAGTPA